MDFGQRLRIRVVKHFLHPHGYVAGLGENIDPVLVAAHARQRQPVKPLVVFLVIRLAGQPILRPDQLVQDLGVVENPGSRGSERHQADQRQRRPGPRKAETGDSPALGPAALRAPRPEHDGGNGQQSAEQNPVQREPAPGRNIGRIAEHIRVSNVRSGPELNQIRSHVERPPDKEIDDQKSNVNEIANILVGRQGVNEERQHSKE